MLPAVEVEFESSNVNHANQTDDITNIDIDEDSAAGNNIIHIIIYKKKKLIVINIYQSSKHRATFFIYGSFPNPLSRLLPHN